jgi:hypothetical protein
MSLILKHNPKLPKESKLFFSINISHPSHRVLNSATPERQAVFCFFFFFQLPTHLGRVAGSINYQ